MNRDTSERIAIPEDIVELAREVYGDRVEQFMVTPRRSLGLKSPLEAIADGEADAVRGVVIDDYEGHWA